MSKGRSTGGKFFCFPSSEMVFFSSLFLKDSFTGSRIRGLQSFFVSFENEEGHLGGSVGKASDFDLGHDLGS